MGKLDYFNELKQIVVRSKYILFGLMLFAPLFIRVSSASATPTYSNFPISSSYLNPGKMTLAGGALWYIQDTSSTVANNVGRMTTSGTITDYNIGYPPSTSSFTVVNLTTGADGNVWFSGKNSSGMYVGYLNISTGAVTFYASSVSSYAAGPIAAGSDGNMYYAVKNAGSPAYTYLRSLNPSTGTTTTKWTFNVNANITSLTNGLDARLWATDSYAASSQIYAISLSGGTSNTYNASANSYPGGIVAGTDGNMWFIEQPGVTHNIVKMTTSGSMTKYTLASGLGSSQLAAGSDGAIWFIDGTKLGRITTMGAVTESTIPGTGVSGVRGLVSGPDDAMWFDYKTSSPVTNNIGRISTAPAFSNFPISSSYLNPGEMTVAGGALWYIEDTSSVVANNIGKMTTSGTITDYNVGFPSGASNFTISHLTTGADGNVWFSGKPSGTTVYIGCLNISTGAVTFYASSISSYAVGPPLTAGSDGNIYYAIKDAGSPAYTHLLYLNPTTGATTTKRTFDVYANITSLSNGTDGRLWSTDSYAASSKIYATSLSGGTSDVYNATSNSYPSGIIAGTDGNMWFIEQPGVTHNIVKMTTSGSMTKYTLASGLGSSQLAAGSDGAVWFIDGTKIGRITGTGLVAEYSIPGTGVSGVRGLVSGPDDAMWFDYKTSSPASNNVGRLGY